MQQRKYFKTSFLRPGLFIVAVVVCFGGRRPDVGAQRAAAGKAAAAGRVAGEAPAEAVIATGDGVTWMTVEQATDKLQSEKRPVLIDLYTTWCGWCRQMDRKTYSNKQVAAYLQDKFYTVKVDAETHSVITWDGKTYPFNPQYQSNEFALYLTHGRLEFPTTIIIPPGEAPQAIPGYMEPKELELLVKYFGEGAYKNRSFDDYQKGFKASW